MYSPPSGLRYASSEVSQPLCNDFGSSINSRHVAGEAERHHHGLRGSDAWLRVYGPARGPVCKLMRCMPMNQVKRSRLLPALVLGSWECLRGPKLWFVVQVQDRSQLPATSGESANEQKRRCPPGRKSRSGHAVVSPSVGFRARKATPFPFALALASRSWARGCQAPAFLRALTDGAAQRSWAGVRLLY
jgi:hypothetical protein